MTRKNNNNNSQSPRGSTNIVVGSNAQVSSSSASSAATRLSEYNSRAEQRRREERDQAAAIVPILASRSYHIPGNTWRQDWIHYFANNHPVLGLCFHHKLHPVGKCKRIIVLIGSIACGLVISNLLYLYFLSTDQGVSGEFISVDFRVNATVASQSVGISNLSFTNYQITLWTVGTFIHTMFDLSVWYLAACGCCQPGGSLESWGPHLRWMGSYITLLAVTLTAATATLVVVVRATLNDHPEAVNKDHEIQSGGLFDDAVQFGETSGPGAYQFLVSWCIEVLISWFIYNFAIGTVFFSGVLGCYRLPLLGGRPREVMLLEKQEGVHLPPTPTLSDDEECGVRSPPKK
jgi:hypothetical protein